MAASKWWRSSMLSIAAALTAQMTVFSYLFDTVTPWRFNEHGQRKPVFWQAWIFRADSAIILRQLGGK